MPADACGSDGIFNKIATDKSTTADVANFTSGDNAWQVAGNLTLAFSQPIVNPAQQNGSGVDCSEASRLGLQIVQGDVPLLCTPAVFDYFIPFVTGMAWSSGTSFPTLTAPGNLHILSHNDAKLALYGFVAVNQVTIESQSGSPIMFSMNCFGKSRTFETATWPSGLNVSVDVPYMHTDAEIDIDGTTYEFRSWKVTHTRNIGPRYFGSNVPCGFKPNSNRVTKLELSGPYNATTIADLLQSGLGPLDVTITLTHPTAGVSASIRMQALQIDDQKDPSVGAGEILLPLTGTARSLSGGDSGGVELICTSDTTPS